MRPPILEAESSICFAASQPGNLALLGTLRATLVGPHFCSVVILGSMVKQRGWIPDPKKTNPEGQSNGRVLQCLIIICRKTP